jgi:putative ABC transport system substrate-binding protein
MRRIAGAALISLVAIAPELADADEGRKLPVVGQVLFTNPSNARPWDEAFRGGLHDLGYVEGKNITVVVRYANGDSSQLPAILQELIALRVDVLWTPSAVVLAAKEATKTIPIVCPTMGDPVEYGLVASLAHPGGNLTGLSWQMTDSDPKRLELAREVVPSLRHLGLLFESYPNSSADVNAFRRLARSAGIAKVDAFEGRNLEEIQAALKAMDKDRPQALYVWSSNLLSLHRNAILGSTAHRLPVIADGREFAAAGALISYAPNSYDLYRRSATYVDKILKGAKPSDLPIEQPNKFELIVNLRMAKVLGITIPESVLLRADELIR